MNQLEIRFGTTNWAEIFTRSVSFQDHSSLKISAQKDHSKWEIDSEGGGLLKVEDNKTEWLFCFFKVDNSVQHFQRRLLDNKMSKY
jgi:hypothetical protein